MQVTGSNSNPTTTSRLSIRLTDGQSLHCEVWPKIGVDESIKGAKFIIELCGPVVTTYPKALEESLRPSEVLTRSGIALAADDRVFAFGESRNIGFLARLSAENAEVVDALEAGGAQVIFTSPLERCVRSAVAATRRSKNVHLEVEHNVVYVAYAEDMKLRYAEIVPLADEDAMVNLLALLNQDYDLRKAQFVLGGEEGKRYYKTLKEYFRRVECAK